MRDLGIKEFRDYFFLFSVLSPQSCVLCLRVPRFPRAKPVLEGFKAWMETRKDQTPPQGLPGKAINYTLSRWPELVRHLENGYITPDNNAAQNAIRPFVVGRKNWLFAGSPNGADAAATLYSLIETSKACERPEACPAGPKSGNDEEVVLIPLS